MDIKFKALKGIQVSLFELTKNRLGMKLNHWVDRWIERIEKEIQFVEKSRIKLCEKYAKKDKEGKPLMKKEKDQQIYDIEDVKGFEKEFGELLEQSIDIDLKPLILDDKDIKLEYGYQKLLEPIMDQEFLKSLDT